MSTSGSRKISEDKEKRLPKLPWWVELFFVQIGLPDKWLPRILRNKNKSQAFITDNSKFFLYLFFIVISLIYLNPYTKYFRSQNICINSEKKQLSKTTIKDKNIKNILLSEAVKACNGINKIN
tara:strand:- start:2706 stop:3074 length:369 start_codon:yes stop_codon:yes gene_type:complete